MHHRRTALLATAAVLVGGSALAVPAAGAATTPPKVGASVVKVGPKDGGGEPSIASGPEGNLYVSYPSDSGMAFYRSFNGGAKWLKGATAQSSSGDTTVNVDRSGAVYESNLNGDSDLQVDVFKSFDFGASFPQRAKGVDGMDASSNPLLSDRQWVDAYIPPGKTTNQARVYLEYHDFGPSQIWVNTSKDGARTFGTPVDVVAQSPAAEAASVCNTIPGGAKVVQSGPHAGRVYVAWLAADAPTNVATGCNLTQLDTFHTVWVAWSDDEGQTWTSHEVFDGGFGHDASALFADLTLDDAGNPVVAFGDNLDDEWDMFVEASYDGGISWNGSYGPGGAPYKVNADTGTHFFPAVASGDPGKIDVSYIATPTRIATLPYGKPAPGGGAGAKWYLYDAQTLNAKGGHPTWQVTKVTRDPIHVGDVCTLGIFCVSPQSNRSLLDFIDAAIGPKGYLHSSFTQDTAQHNGIYAANQTTGQPVIAPR